MQESSNQESLIQELHKYSYCRVNIALAALQVAVFALCLLTGNRLYAAGRCGTDLVLDQKEYYRLLTSVFLHSGLYHIGSNMLVQILMGNAVERNLGHIKYLILYLAAGVGGNVISVLYDRAQGVNTYSVGASGAVFGVMGALLVLIIRGRKNCGPALPCWSERGSQFSMRFMQGSGPLIRTMRRTWAAWPSESC